MKPIRPRILEQDGLAVLTVDVKTMFENILNCYLAGNQRSGAILPIASTDIWDLTKLATSGFSWGKPPWMDTIRSDTELMDMRKDFDEFFTPFKKWVGGLLSEPKPVRNYAEWLAGQLLNLNKHKTEDEGVWGQKFVTMPALGWPRSALQLKVNAPNADSNPTQTTMTQCASICSPWSMGISATLQIVDQTRLTPALIPAMKGIAKIEPRDMPLGAPVAWRNILKSLYSVFVLYAWQGTLLSLDVNERLRESCWQRAYDRYAYARLALKAYKDDIAPYYTARRHPFVSMITHCLNSGNLDTSYGVKEALYAWCKIPKVNHAASSNRLEDDLVDFVLRAYGEDGRNATSELWGDCQALTGGDGDYDTIVGIARQLRSLSDIFDMSNSAATALGWQDIRGEVGTISQVAADYIICDGLKYSDRPEAGVLGLRPVLSGGNVKYASFSVRFQQNWNGTGMNKTINSNISWSPMVVDGYQSATTTEAIITRLYLPLGMWMGENDYDVYLSETLGTAKHFQAYIKFVASKGSVFLEQFYSYKELEAINPKWRDKLRAGEIDMTDWDAVAQAGTAEQSAARMQLLFTRADTGETILKDAITSKYMKRSKFFHRFPVQMARGDVIFYDRDGIYWDTLDWMGDIAFDDSEFTLSYSTDVLERIVNSAVPSAVLKPESLPDGGKTQVVEKEGT